MKILSLSILLLLVNASFSQKVKQIVEDDYELFCRNEYTVLKKDKSIKHGHFRSVWINGNPKAEGFYSFNMKDSLWIIFNRFRPIIESRGYYKEGKKIGVWEYFDDKEQPMNRYNHSTAVLSFSTFKDTNKTHLVRTTDTIVRVKVERAPFFLLGSKNRMRIIQDNITYPLAAVEENISGTVAISFFVNKYGKAIDHSITSSIGGGCDEEALRVVRLIPDEWVPGVYKNALQEMEMVVLITFQLE